MILLYLSCLNRNAMKKIILTIFAAALSIVAYSQDFSGLKDYQFASKEEYKAKEPQLKECVQYLLSKPYDKNDVNRQIAQQFMVIWMTGTPDYTFIIGKGYEFVSAKKSDADLMVIYFAGMISFVLDNPDKAKDVPAAEKAAIVKVVDYYADENNNLKPGKQIKKLIEAKKQGKLDEAIQY